MNIVILVLSFVVLSTGVYSGIKTYINRIDTKEEVLSHQSDSEVEEEDNVTSTLTPIPTAKAEVKVDEQNDTTDTVVEDITNSDWIYPGANTRLNDGNLIVIDTVDHHQKVTDWYKDKIKATGGNVTSFVTTATNGEIKNELEGAGGSTHVEVKIEKSAISDTVIVSINFMAD